MITQPEIEVAILQICNRLGMNAVLPSDNMIINAWKSLVYGEKDTVAIRVYKVKEVHNQVIEGVREFYKEKRRREQEK